MDSQTDMTTTVCIAGKNLIAAEAIRFLAANFPELQIIAVPNGHDSGEDGWQPSFRKASIDVGAKVASLEEVEGIEDLLFISLECEKILRPHRFASEKLYNIHFSLLPAYKGVYTSAHPILRGETQSGVTLHRIDPGIDTGDIVASSDFPIEQDDTAGTLYAKYLSHGLELFKAQFANLLSGEFEVSPQAAEGASYFSLKSIDYSNLNIDFKKCATEVHNQLRAYTFREFQLPVFQDWPIGASSITARRSNNKPGTVIEEDDRCFTVATIDFDVLLEKDYYSFLWQACELGSLENVERCAGMVRNINLRDGNGWSALVRAVYNGNLKIASSLLALGADPNSTNYKGTTALMYALSVWERTGDPEGLELLLQSGADPLKQDRFGKNLWDWCAEKGFPSEQNIPLGS